MKIEEIKEKVRRGEYYISFTHTEKFRRRRISTGEIEEAISRGEIIEDYPYDVRGASCLILGLTIKGKPLHIVCSRVEEEIIIITAYEPGLSEWEEDLRTRR